MRVILYDIYHGPGKRSHIIYAHVKDAETKEMIVSATLDYCLDAISARGWVLVKET